MAKDQLQPQNVPANFCALARLFYDTLLLRGIPIIMKVFVLEIQIKGDYLS